MMMSSNVWREYLKYILKHGGYANIETRNKDNNNNNK